MILSTNTTCDLITVTSENGYIADIVTADGTKCCHVLELGTNCCEPTLILPIRSLYDLSYNIRDCSDIGGGNYRFNIDILNIDVGCVQSYTYPDTNNVGTVTVENPLDLTFRYDFIATGDQSLQVSLTTCTGLTYVLDFTIFIANLADVCATVTLGIPVITYPDLPTGVTINGSNQIELDPTALGLSTVFTDGIYFAGLSQTNTSGITTAESDSIFINCNTTCNVINAIAQDNCSNLYLLLDGLIYADDCDTVSYQDKCDIWFVIAKKLGYFKNNPCGTISDCGCNK
jgi:hypothetical protein